MLSKTDQILRNVKREIESEEASKKQAISNRENEKRLLRQEIADLMKQVGHNFEVMAKESDEFRKLLAKLYWNHFSGEPPKPREFAWLYSFITQSVADCGNFYQLTLEKDRSLAIRSQYVSDNKNPSIPDNIDKQELENLKRVVIKLTTPEGVMNYILKEKWEFRQNWLDRETPS